MPISDALTEVRSCKGLHIQNKNVLGERDPVTLARLCHRGVKSSEDTIAKSLEGDYRPEHLFALRDARIVALLKASQGVSTYAIEFVEQDGGATNFWGISFPSNA